MIDTETLIEQARKARAKAYAPYSHFQVGAALVDIGQLYIHGGGVGFQFLEPAAQGLHVIL